MKFKLTFLSGVPGVMPIR